MSDSILMLPGIGNSGPLHWQSLWEQSDPQIKRVQQRDWNNPICEEWVATLELAVKQSGSHVVLVAHSLACLVVAHWAVSTHTAIDAALLVSVPDINGPNFPGVAKGFENAPSLPFNFKSAVVVSEDDPYGSPDHAVLLAHAWGSQVVNIGKHGHINASSGLGFWSEGYQLLNQLRVRPEKSRT